MLFILIPKYYNDDVKDFSINWIDVRSVINLRTIETASCSLCRNVDLQGTTSWEGLRQLHNPVVSFQRK